MCEVSNLSEGTGRGRIDFLRGNRGGMLGKNSRGTWESLLYTQDLKLSKTGAYNPKGKGQKVE